MDPQSLESFELQFLSYRNWRLVIALAVGGIACLWRLKRRSREAWLVAGAISLVAFREVGLELAAMRTMRFVSVVAPSIPSRESIAWFNLLINPLLAAVVAAAWGLIFYAAFGPGSGESPKYLIEDGRSEQKSA